ncbi:MAG: integration host factor subunit beta [Alphaproteobacteria bacterium]|nr:MAG: integration host factor subunit beta [Alphaproteobacteria bacterium]
MTKSELILKITSKNSYLYHKDVYKIIDTLFNCVTQALKNGDRVELRGFGTFTTKLRNARIGRNPKTGDPVAIPQKKMPFFKMGKSMKERINS